MNQWDRQQPSWEGLSAWSTALIYTTIDVQKIDELKYMEDKGIIEKY